LGSYIAKKIDDARFVWFEKSNQWVKMDEPQWFIFLLYLQGIDRNTAIEKTADFEDIPDHSLLVNNLYDSLEILLDGEFEAPIPQGSGDTNYLIQSPFKHCYRFGDKIFSVGYNSPYLVEYIHRPLQYLEQDALSGDNVNAHFDLLYDEMGCFLYLNGKPIASVSDVQQLKQRFFVELASLLYETGENGWMTIFHASAVMVKGSLVVFSSSSGSGKSTMVARLQAMGYPVFADDFVPVRMDNQRVCPFPPAISIKKGSLNVLEEEQIALSFTGGQSGYILPSVPVSELEPLNVGIIILLKFDRDAVPVTEQFSPGDALTEHLGESWVCNHASGVEQFLEWLAGLKCYRVIFNNGPKGAEAILQILDNIS
jgi:hypothetical protein